MNELEQAIENAIKEGKTTSSPTLKALAIAMQVQPIRIYTVAKEPVPYQIYDARVFNWDAIEKYCRKRFDPDVGIGTFDALVAKAIECDAELAKLDRRTLRRPETAPRVTVNGKTILARKIDVNLGDEVFFKDDVSTYVVVYKTETHLAMQIKGTSDLLCYGNWTFNNRVVTV